jgi:hypothetical protein
MPTPQPRRGRWFRTFGWLFFAWVVVSVFTIVWLFGQILPAPVDITVNGTSVTSGLDLAGLPAAHKLALAVVAAVAALVALLLAFAALVVVAAALVPVLLLAVGLPVLVGGVVLLALLVPFVLLAWMLWRAARPPRPAAMTP